MPEDIGYQLYVGGQPATPVLKTLSDAQVAASSYLTGNQSVHIESYGGIAPSQFWRYDRGEQTWIASASKPRDE